LVGCIVDCWNLLLGGVLEGVVEEIGEGRKGVGLVYTSKRSTSLDPGSFAPMTGAVTVIDIDDEFERVVVEEPCHPGVTPQCFGTVEVVVP
jgi:hypothetical protein